MIIGNMFGSLTMIHGCASVLGLLKATGTPLHSDFHLCSKPLKRHLSLCSGISKPYPDPYKYQERMWAFSNTIRQWKGSWAFVGWMCPTFVSSFPPKLNANVTYPLYYYASLVVRLDLFGATGSIHLESDEYEIGHFTSTSSKWITNN